MTVDGLHVNRFVLIKDRHFACFAILRVLLCYATMVGVGFSRAGITVYLLVLLVNSVMAAPLWMKSDDKGDHDNLEPGGLQDGNQADTQEMQDLTDLVSSLVKHFLFFFSLSLAIIFVASSFIVDLRSYTSSLTHRASE